MATSTIVQKVEVSKKSLWSFIENRGQWATLIPGYLHHEFVSEKEMIWVFEGDFGIVKKPVKLSLTTEQLNEQEKFVFELKGLSDNINGGGAFELVEEDGQLALSGSLSMKAGGFLAAMINPILEKFVPDTVEILVSKMVEQVSKTTV